MTLVVALHLAVISAAAAVIARELARELVYLRVAYAGPRVVRPWIGTVIARPWTLGARASEAPVAPRRRRSAQLALPDDAPGNDNDVTPLRPAPTARETWPNHVVVEISTGVRVYRLAPGAPWQTREEVEVHGFLVGWCDTLGGTSLPMGMRSRDLDALPRARRAPPEPPAPPIAVDVSSWCALPPEVRETVRCSTDATKALGVMRLGALSGGVRRFLEELFEREGLAVIERTPEQIVWGSR